MDTFFQQEGEKVKAGVGRTWVSLKPNPSPNSKAAHTSGKASSLAPSLPRTGQNPEQCLWPTSSAPPPPPTHSAPPAHSLPQAPTAWQGWLSSAPVARGFPPEAGIGPHHGPRPFQVFPAHRPPFNPGFITEPPNRFHKPPPRPTNEAHQPNQPPTKENKQKTEEIGETSEATAVLRSMLGVAPATASVPDQTDQTVPGQGQGAPLQPQRPRSAAKKSRLAANFASK